MYWAPGRNYLGRSLRLSSGNRHHKPNYAPRYWGRILIAGILICFLAVGTLAIVPAAFPGFGADMADLLRSIFGPQPGAILEGASFQLHDKLNHFCSQIGGGKAQ